MSEAVAFQGVSKRFDTVIAVDQVDLSIRDGEFFAMLGPSGSGKTTCLRLIAGFEQPSEGRILLHGADVAGLPPYERDVNTVFQDYALFPHMTVAENVAYSLRVRKVDQGERTRRVEEALALVRLEHFGGRKPTQLSGGQRQRVALARALINRPSVLLLDEPLGALDLKLRQAMQVELKALQREVGITFIFVTHDQEEALTMSDRLAVFAQGRIEQVGTPREIYEKPANEFVAGFVGASNLVRSELAERLFDRVGSFTVRPEKIKISESYDPSSNRQVIGTVAAVEYLGAFSRISVDFDGQRFLVIAPNIDGFIPAQTGAQVALSWPASAMHPLSEYALPQETNAGTPVLTEKGRE